MNNNFEPVTERITARISPKTKVLIAEKMALHGMTKESQYIKLAIENQLKTDKTPNTPEP